MLKQLHVEAYQFHADRRDRAQFPQAFHPGQDILEPALKRGRQPPLAPSPVAPSRLSVSGLSAATRSAHCPAVGEGILDGLPAMGEFSGKDDFATLRVEDGDASGTAARVDLEA
jgi:hypothetical protein